MNYEIKEDSYDSNLNYSGIPKPFLAYALGGSETSTQVYFVNFCMEQDFEHLKSLNYDVTNQIVMCKYGKIFRGNKVKLMLILGIKKFFKITTPPKG